MKFSAGTRVKVVGGSIQRSNGAAWPGDTGVVDQVTGDGYVVNINGNKLDRVKDGEVEKA